MAPCLRLVLLCALAAGAFAPEPLCSADGRWLEVAACAVERGEVQPEVMCWREPACVIHTHLSRARCSTRTQDSDWPQLPYVSPVVRGRSEPPSLGLLLDRYLRNKTLLFVGDSITESIWDFLLCESHREGLRSIRSDDVERGKEGGKTDLTTQSLRDTTFRTQVATFWDAWFDAPWGEGGIPLAMDTRVELFPATHTILARPHIHRFYEADAAALAQLGDVVVYNFGLHYDLENEKQAKEYKADVRQLAALMAPLGDAPGRAAFFRETSAQHFRDTGAFENWEQAHLVGNLTKCECLQMSATVELRNKMKQFNDMAHEVLAQHAPTVPVLPFYDFTARLHMAHEEDFCSYKKEYRDDTKLKYSCCDCSHFCYSPQFSDHVLATLEDGLKGSRVLDRGH